MNLPKGWSERDLASVCALVTDGTHHSPENQKLGDVPYITAKNIKWSGVDIQNLTYVTENVHQAIYRRCPVVKGDVLLIKDGATTGIAAINQIETPFSMLSSVALLRPIAEILSNRFVWYWLRAPKTQSVLVGAMNGSAIRRLTLTAIGQTEISVPPFAEQLRIVAKLDVLTVRITRARAELDRISTLAKKLRKQSLKLAYSGKLTADWRGEAQSIKDEGLLPATWRSHLLGDIADVKSGLTLGKKRSQGDRLIELPYLRVANVQRGTLSLGVVKRVLVTPGEAEMLYLQPGDLLMNEGGDRDKLGRGCVWNGEIRNCIHQNHVFRVRLKNSEILPRYISHYTNEFGSEYFFQNGTQTTNLASLSKTKLLALPLPLAPIDEQVEILNRLEAAFARADRLEGEATRAAALLDRLEASILAKAFRGELVSQDPADEPAAAMLDRIRAERTAPSKLKRGRRAASSGP